LDAGVSAADPVKEGAGWVSVPWDDRFHRGDSRRAIEDSLADFFSNAADGGLAWGVTFAAFPETACRDFTWT
jgi:hypothetical protein